MVDQQRQRIDKNTKAPKIGHPTFAAVKDAFPDCKFRATEFRGQSTLIVEPADLHKVLKFLRDDERTKYNFLSDVIGLDYLNYPAETIGRFAVAYMLVSFDRDDRFWVKTYLDPSIPTESTTPDPALELESACSVWPGAEWPEREVYDMFGIRFKNHPDLRRILTWGDYPAHPLRKDYPLRGRGERESYRVVDRSSS